MPTTETDQLGDEQPDVLIARIESSWDRWLTAVSVCSPEQLNQANTCAIGSRSMTMREPGSALPLRTY